MADQTYNLTQTGAEVQAIINDANGVKGAGATTSLTTDYIMLKDTSGAYHKIQKSSFTEAVRNTLASLLVNNDKGTTISQIAAIASGDFGSVTPANLASVLGAHLEDYNILPNNVDIDTFYQNGIFKVSSLSDASTILHLPFTPIGGFVLWYISPYDNMMSTAWQIIFYGSNMYRHIYVRSGGKMSAGDTNVTWGSWQEVSFTNLT